MDPISNMLTQIRNAQERFHREIKLPSSKLKAEICRILKEEGFISDYRVVEQDNRASLQVTLKYKGKRGREKVLSSIERVSRPGQRVYVSVGEIPRVRNGLGIAILSTPQGVMTGKQAKAKRMGGEVLVHVW
ncbi:30S ribosomal protein S8 [Candidatus Acetothermia bacterium]|nr:30S ribosomal protein S8 [Candidatus Acetothermia bacterium]MBI3460996.1 30S ribosomal protein S8 [Candidatus Acetothermia bacterium]MBI3659194.1 30S ribosomal protein S8 [Candidatus Acetothermia bacterium]